MFAARLNRVAPRIYRVGVPLSGAFLLLDDRITVIDTGPRWGHRAILRAVRELGRAPEEIDRVGVTHGHFDHFGGAAALRRGGSPTLLAHALDAPVLRGERMAPLPIPFGRMIQHTVAHALGARIEVDGTLDDGFVSPVLGGLRAVHTPGHTPGHTAFYLPEAGVLFAGDAVEIRAGQIAPPRIREDEAAARASIRRLANLDVEVLAPSHFPAQRGEVRERLLAAVAG